MALKTDPGFLTSGTVHGVALVFLLLNLSKAPTFEEPPESVAVETISTSELNQIMNGEKTAKPLPVPQRRADKVAEVVDPKPLPPLAEAKKDVLMPPSPDKPRDDPGQDDKPVPTPPERVAASPPPTPEPTPPRRPVETIETPVPPQKPAPEPPKSVEDKPPPPDDAEPVEPKPPVRPKVEPKKEAKTEPKPDPKPIPKPPEKKQPVKEAKQPEPPKKPEPRLKLDELAKLLEDKKDTKPASKPKAGNDAKEAPRRDFDPHSISALLDREAPQRKASTGRTLTQVASLGAPNAHAATLSPSMMAQLDQILIDQYHGCWSYFGLGGAQKYVPEVRVHLAQDGTLVGQPALLNPPGDPNLRSLADSAIRAVQKCNPMKIPDRFTPYYEAWAHRVVRFNPEDML